MPLINDPPVEEPAAEKPAAAEKSAPSDKKSLLSTNSMLKATEDKIESNLTDDVKPAYTKIVVAGNKAGMQGGENSVLAKLADSKDPIGDAGRGAAGMVFALRKESKDTMPVNAMILAGATLMVHALDFLEKAGVVEVGAEEIAKATKEYSNTVFKNMGVTPQMLTKGNETVQNITKDPAVMEQMRRKAGLVKAPGTSSPTDVPVEEEEEPDAV